MCATTNVSTNRCRHGVVVGARLGGAGGARFMGSSTSSVKLPMPMDVGDDNNYYYYWLEGAAQGS
eukprot:3219126-Prorocentrum_lima.AAC.1